MKRKRHVPVKKRARKKQPDPPASSSGAPMVPASSAATGEGPKAPLVSPSKPKQMVQGVREDTGVPDEILEELRGTTPWLTFFAVLNFISAVGCLALAGFTVVGALVVNTPVDGETAAVSSSTVGLLVVAVGYLIGMLVYISLGLRMLQFCKAVSRVRYSADPKDLEFVLAFMRSIWQVIGAMLLVGIVMGVLSVLFAR